MRSILMAAMVAAGTTAYAAEPGTEDLQALLEAQQRQIELLQQQLDATQASLDQISQQVKTNTEASVEANEKAEILAENIESRPVVAASATKLGGYGELHMVG